MVTLAAIVVELVQGPETHTGNALRALLDNIKARTVITVPPAQSAPLVRRRVKQVKPRVIPARMADTQQVQGQASALDA